MVDELTQSVLDCQDGKVPLDSVRNDILLEAFSHFRRYRRRSEDEVSEFLLELHERVPGMIERFRYLGLPFRHFLLRSVRWQWSTFLSQRSRKDRQDSLASEYWQAEVESVALDQDPCEAAEPRAEADLTGPSRKRLVLLALKASPDLEPQHLEQISLQAGVDLAWLQACLEQLRTVTQVRRKRQAVVMEKRGDFYLKRIVAEDQARRESDPERRQRHEATASLYRSRLANLQRQRMAHRASPTHQELAHVLEMPKGSVDSGLYHLKRQWPVRYSGPHDDSSGDE